LAEGVPDTNGVHWSELVTALGSIAVALLEKQRRRYLLAVLKGAAIGALAGALLLPLLFPHLHNDEVDRWLLVNGIESGSALGMGSAVLALQYRLRRREH
jgi:hypothetical protein